MASVCGAIKADHDQRKRGTQNRLVRSYFDIKSRTEEEEDIFARARKVIDDSRAAEIGETFRTRKAKEIKLVDKKQKDKLAD